MRPLVQLSSVLVVALLTVGCSIPAATPADLSVPTRTIDPTATPVRGTLRIPTATQPDGPLSTAPDLFAVTEEILTLVNADRVARGLAVLERDAALDALAEAFAASGLSDSLAKSTDLSHLLVNSWYVTYRGRTPAPDENTAREQVSYCLGEERLREALRRPEARRTGLGAAVVGDTIYFVQVFDVLWAQGGDGGPIALVENPHAMDVSWEELKAFLRTDDVNHWAYDPEQFVCADFAEALHNRAERAGIRAAYVAVEFGDGPGHALNAFQVDDSLVFIEPQGDQVAYVEAGRAYGVASLDGAPGFTYDDFLLYSQWVSQWRADLDQFNDEVLAFNTELQEYEEAVSLHNSDPTQEQYDRLTEWQARLDEHGAALDEWSARLTARELELGLTEGYWDPLQALAGVGNAPVTRLYVHW